MRAVMRCLSRSVAREAAERQLRRDLVVLLRELAQSDEATIAALRRDVAALLDKLGAKSGANDG